jgi:hypothetical protein
MQLRYFLVEFDGHTRPAKVSEFADMQTALAALSVREPLEPPGGETVLLFAESEEVLRVTHSGYFEDPFEGFRRVVHEKTDEIVRRAAPQPATTR